MTIEDIYNLVNFIINKEKSGNAFTPSKFNTVLDAVNTDFFKTEYENAQKIAQAKGVKVNAILNSIDSLREFRYKETVVPVTTITGTADAGGSSTLLKRKTGTNFTTSGIRVGDPIRNTTDGSLAEVVTITDNDNITTTALQGGTADTWAVDDVYSVTTGVIPLSGLTKTYIYWISMTATHNSIVKGIEFISDAELEDRLTNLLAKPLEYYPAAIVNDTEVILYPTDVVSADFTYLRLPVQPVYAWITDSYDREKYLATSFYTKPATIDQVPVNGHIHQITVAYAGGGAVTICDYTAATADGLTKQVLAQKMADSVNDLYETTGYFASVGVEEFTIYLNSSAGVAANYVIAEVDVNNNFTIATPIDDGTGGSTGLEWNDVYHTQFAQQVLLRAGVNLKLQQIEAYATREKEE